MLKGKNVLVAGGAGYIGSVVTAVLLEREARVVVYDNLQKGHRDAVPDAAHFVEGDIRDASKVVETLQQERIDAVVHMAASSLVGESMTAPDRYYDNNVRGGLTLLDAMRDAGVPALVFSSTAAVYGDPEADIIDEAHATTPTNAYGETKLAFERALQWYGRAHGLRSVSLRYFNAAGAAYGVGERHTPETHLIPLVLRAAQGGVEGAPLTIYGDDYDTDDGTCIRDYVHVADLADAHVLALEALLAQRVGVAAYNLGNGDGYSVREVIEAAERVTGLRVPVRVGARRPGDPARLVASSARIRRELEWSPKRESLDDIIASAWELVDAMSLVGRVRLRDVDESAVHLRAGSD